MHDRSEVKLRWEGTGGAPGLGQVSRTSICAQLRGCRAPQLALVFHPGEPHAFAELRVKPWAGIPTTAVMQTELRS